MYKRQMLYVAECMALGGWMLMREPGRLEQVWRDFSDDKAGE